MCPPSTGASSGDEEKRRPRILCIHGFRTSGAIMKSQVERKWPESVVGRLELIFSDGPFPARGKSDVEGLFPPPYYEWFQFNQGGTEYENFEECMSYIENFMLQHGPFDGLMGFSQGSFLAGALPGFQAKGLFLTKIPKLKFVIIISGGRLRADFCSKAYSPKVACPSIHFIGEVDFLKESNEDLLEAFEEPTVIRHPVGHTVPRLNEEAERIMLSFIHKIHDQL